MLKSIVLLSFFTLPFFYLVIAEETTVVKKKDPSGRMKIKPVLTRDGKIKVNEINTIGRWLKTNFINGREVPDVLNFVSNTRGNKNALIKPAQVKAGRYY